jgi:hypothetical protein
MIFERRLLLSINKNAFQRHKHPARNERYDFPIPSAHAALTLSLFNAISPAFSTFNVDVLLAW